MSLCDGYDDESKETSNAPFLDSDCRVAIDPTQSCNLRFHFAKRSTGNPRSLLCWSLRSGPPMGGVFYPRSRPWAGLVGCVLGFCVREVAHGRGVGRVGPPVGGFGGVCSGAW
ncbi:hypothetical protein KEM60_01301 [Austwickia sp. TVS 96-490-7B]|nr:hypothetical protein [Austwickia sp. TVS 96-490-7B]